MTEGDGDSVDMSCQQTPSQAVVEAVAAAEGVPPEELCPPAYESLYTVVDPEALDSLFASQPDGIQRPNGEISFPFCEYDVTIEWNGEITLEELSD
ncbi:HalOD1 output domain-containing protein [Natronorubrum daqingense]|uniref:Halobacterial output domain-containing protein n=1 Tax=Natronorubrum daqingense TaxID=588898 RepID=A0A1N6YIF0_9EURY|nr:HalOD1 output domain-containing protein [Natronorubrum daqingense]APX95658.1 hypothetical protein BB347_02970 [Natronorubrum daqingense]SIR14289.1 hypothetical protein SAMN05421809_0451 [Natronorubrum daqingense]